MQVNRSTRDPELICTWRIKSRGASALDSTGPPASFQARMPCCSSTSAARVGGKEK